MATNVTAAASTADLFLSYASEDRTTAAHIASALQARGWTVWWDRTLVTGDNFRAVIDDKLSSSRGVIVLWSPSSIASPWVPEEAAQGRDRGVLIPVKIADVSPPIDFRSLHTANLAGWNGDLAAPEFLRLIDDIQLRVPRTPSAQVTADPPPPVPPAGQPFGGARWVAAALSFACFLGLWTLFRARPQPFTLDGVVTTSHVFFTYDRAQQEERAKLAPLLNGLRFRTVTASSFTAIEIPRGSVTEQRDGMPPRPLGSASIRFVPDPGSAAKATFRDISIESLVTPAAAHVLVEAVNREEGAGLGLHVAGGRSTLQLTNPDADTIVFECENCTVAGASFETETPGLKNPRTFVVNGRVDAPLNLLGSDTVLGFDIVPAAGEPFAERFRVETLQVCGSNAGQHSASLTGTIVHGNAAEDPTRLDDASVLSVVPRNGLVLSDLQLAGKDASSRDRFSFRASGEVLDVREGMTCASADRSLMPRSLLRTLRAWPWMTLLAMVGLCLMAAALYPRAVRLPRGQEVT